MNHAALSTAQPRGNLDSSSTARIAANRAVEEIQQGSVCGLSSHVRDIKQIGQAGTGLAKSMNGCMILAAVLATRESRAGLNADGFQAGSGQTSRTKKESLSVL